MEETRTTYHVACDYCDWNKDVSFVCPKCDKPFCAEDHEQATRTAIIGFLHLSETIEKLKGRIHALENTVNTCKYCKK